MAVTNRHRALNVSAPQVRRLFHALDASGAFDAPMGELSVAFLDNQAMTELHADFLDDPTTTDVITFEGDPLAEQAGEICVCADVAAAFAETHELDFSRELSLYLIHGYLHLAGFDDLEPALKRKMRAAEKRAMKIVDAAEALPAFSWKKNRSEKKIP